jgi:XTP/dITP diphosphohydrolase
MDINRIVLASGNPGKIRELSALMPQSIEIIPQSVFSIKDAEETGLSFVENAIIKARHASEHSQLPAIADDSGIEVDALDGKPGIYSARYAGVDATTDSNLTKLLKKMEGQTKRQARFQCVMVYMRHAHDPSPIIAQGTWEGEILHQRQGNNGFGYDPLFYVPETQCSAAELDATTKNRLSHRGKALHQLWSRLNGTN